MSCEEVDKLAKSDPEKLKRAVQERCALHEAGIHAKSLPSLYSTATATATATLVLLSGLSSLRAQVDSINALVAAGAHFFELGNRFLEESARAGGSNKIYCLPPNRTV